MKRRDNWRPRCAYCGKFIPLSAFDNGKAKQDCGFRGGPYGEPEEVNDFFHTACFMGFAIRWINEHPANTHNRIPNVYERRQE